MQDLVYYKLKRNELETAKIIIEKEKYKDFRMIGLSKKNGAHMASNQNNSKICKQAKNRNTPRNFKPHAVPTPNRSSSNSKAIH